MNATAAVPWLVFALAAVCHLGVTAYACWRYLLYRRTPSLVFAYLPLGWVTACARELHLLPRWAATPLLCAAAALGVLSVLVILHHEAQQPRPFR